MDFAITACSDEGKDITKSPLTVIQSKVDFKSAGGEGNIVVSSTTPISSVESSDSWCHATSDGAYTVNLDVDEQIDPENRMAMITITDGEGNVKRVAVTQGGLRFNLYENRVVVDDAGNPTYVRMESTGRTHFQHDINWLHPVATGDSLILTAEPNNTGNIRAGMVHITCGNKEDSIYVIQGNISDIVGDYYLVGYSNYTKPGIDNLKAQDVTITEAEGDSLTLTFPGKEEWDLKCNVYFDKRTFMFRIYGGTYLGKSTFNKSYPYCRIGLWSKNNWAKVIPQIPALFPYPIADNLVVCADCNFYTTKEGYVRAPLERNAQTWNGNYEWSAFTFCRYSKMQTNPNQNANVRAKPIPFTYNTAVDAYFIKRTPGIPEYTVKNK